MKLNASITADNGKIVEKSTNGVLTIAIRDENRRKIAEIRTMPGSPLMIYHLKDQEILTQEVENLI